MDIRPIHTDVEYEAALAEIERLFDAAPNTPEGDRLEVFARVVEAYEEQHYSIPAPEPIEAIKYHMESRGLCRRDLEPYLGSRARVAEVLNRKRPLSLEMIRRLYTGLGIAAEILIQPYPLATSAPNKGVTARWGLKAAWNERAGRGTRTGYTVWHSRDERARTRKVLHPQTDCVL